MDEEENAELKSNKFLLFENHNRNHDNLKNVYIDMSLMKVLNSR